MKAMPQRAELRVHAFSNLRGEAIEDLLVARQTGQARLLAPFPRMSCSVKIINDEVKIGQPSCHSRISFVAEAHSCQVTAVIMNNACETGQSVGTLSSKMKTLRQGFCSISSMTSRSKPDSVTAKRKPAVRAAAWASLPPSLWVPQLLFCRG